MSAPRDLGVRRSAGVTAWWGLCALLGALGVLGRHVPRDLLDWQPALALTQPWRSFSAVAVHYSQVHLLVNLAGVAVVAALGWAARVTAGMGVAWVVAWPLTHIGLLSDPQLAHYGGLSGVLHAGVAIAALHLILAAGSQQRRIGTAIAFGLAIKVALEFPWSPASFHAGLGIMVAPLAHLSGVVVGLVCGAAAVLLARCKSRQMHA